MFSLCITFFSSIKDALHLMLTISNVFFVIFLMLDINVVELPQMQSNQLGNQLNVTCSSNGKSSTYFMQNPTSSQIQQLCSQLCSWILTKVMIVGMRCSFVHISISGSHEKLHTAVLFCFYLLPYSGDTMEKRYILPL